MFTELLLFTKTNTPQLSKEIILTCMIKTFSLMFFMNVPTTPKAYLHAV